MEPVMFPEGNFLCVHLFCRRISVIDSIEKNDNSWDKEEKGTYQGAKKYTKSF